MNKAILAVAVASLIVSALTLAVVVHIGLTAGEAYDAMEKKPWFKLAKALSGV